MELSDLSVLYIMDNQEKEESLYSLLCNTVEKVRCTSSILESKQQYLHQSPCSRFVSVSVSLHKDSLSQSSLVHFYIRFSCNYFFCKFRSFGLILQT